MENKAYEFKDMATVDVAESVSENAHLIVEDGGVIKRLSDDAYSKSNHTHEEVYDVKMAFNTTANTMINMNGFTYEALKNKISSYQPIKGVMYVNMHTISPRHQFIINDFQLYDSLGYIMISIANSTVPTTYLLKNDTLTTTKPS